MLSSFIVPVALTIWQFRGLEMTGVTASIWSVLGPTIAIWAAMFLTLFLWNLACAPYRILKDSTDGALQALRGQLAEKEAVIAALKPAKQEDRSVSPDGVREIARILARAEILGTRSVNAVYASIGEPSDLAVQLIDAVKLSGRDGTAHGGVIFPHDTHARGVIVYHYGGSDYEALANEIAQALAAAGIQASIQMMPERTSPGVIFYVARQ